MASFVSSPPRKSKLPPGFIPSPKPIWDPKTKSIPELQQRYNQNKHILDSTTSTSSASYIPNKIKEQAMILERLEQLGVRDLEDALRGLAVSPSSPTSPSSAGTSMRTKQRILANLYNSREPTGNGTASLGLTEAMEIERRAVAADAEKAQREIERRIRKGLGHPDEDGSIVLSREEKEARIWAFMNYKPTDSDMEDDDEDDEDDDNPLGWYSDDQDDGRKGQNIVDPDVPDFDYAIDPMELSDIIRVDLSRASRPDERQ